MTGHRLAKYRKDRKVTQVQLAQAMGVSQTYLSLLEAGKRRFTKELQRKAAKFLDLPPTEVPTQFAFPELPQVSDEQLASDLAGLGYSGFSHLKRSRSRRKNPADVLLGALNCGKRDVRLVEALPWVVLSFPDLKWSEVSRVAKMYDLQNRLGFVTNVARRVAERDGRYETASKLKRQEVDLERSLLVREETLCNETMTQAERKWLARNRPDDARRWNLLTDLSPQFLSYV